MIFFSDMIFFMISTFVLSSCMRVCSVVLGCVVFRLLLLCVLFRLGGPCFSFSISVTVLGSC